MEYCENGEILDYIKEYFKKSEKTEHLPLSEKLRMLKEICGGMLYLHSRHIIHRDLKCENVLLNSSLQCKIMDFGVSRVAKPDDYHRTKRVGTSIYMAPEVCVGNVYTEKCDVFSFSIMIFVVITENQHPYGEHNIYNIEVKVANEIIRPSVEEFEHSLIKQQQQKQQDEEKNYGRLTNIMKRCWRHDAEKRPGFDELIELLEFSEEIDEDEDEEEEEENVTGGSSSSSSSSSSSEDEVDEENEKDKMIESLQRENKKLRKRLIELNDGEFEDF